MKSMLTTEPAILVHLKSVGIVFLILLGFVVSLLALAANQSNFNPHFGTS